ncbi:MAG: EAL domain-containing protein [bacterium]|nr:EAL domain-containing protein [bacterium]
MPLLAGELHRLLLQRDLHMLFQPIVNTRERIVLGYEALVRGPDDSALHGANELFETAQKEGVLAPLERLCRELACARFVELNLPGKLFLNVSPMTLTDPHHPQGETLRILERTGLDPSRVVIELSEHYPTQDFELLARATRHYAGMGFEIAIDDLGSGYSGLRLWSEIRPAYVKIDRHFVANIHDDRIKREFVRFIRDISSRIGCRVIAEGIETANEYLTLHGLGIDNLQGYYLGYPQKNPLPVISSTPFLQMACTEKSLQQAACA